MQCIVGDNRGSLTATFAREQLTMLANRFPIVGVHSSIPDVVAQHRVVRQDLFVPWPGSAARGREVLRSHPMFLVRQNSDGSATPGVLVESILQRDFALHSTSTISMDSFLPSKTVKIRISPSRCLVQRTERQIHLRNRDGESISVEQLIYRIACAVEKTFTETPITIGGRLVTRADLVLVGVTWVSQGTLMAILEVTF